jgi:two-component system cell cycle response regulator DivK
LAKILIVEDNALNIKLFCDLLAAHGHDAQAVTDSRVALDSARDFAPDLVITDIQLPHVSGLELIRMLRDDAQLKTVPIMAVTAYAGAGDEERIRGAGAQAYVSKPISVVKFVAQVDELLGLSSRAESPRKPKLLDLGFLERDVLAHDRVVLLEAQLLRLGARVLLRHVEKAGIGAADELDLDGCRLGHRTRPKCLK